MAAEGPDHRQKSAQVSGLSVLMNPRDRWHLADVQAAANPAMMSANLSPCAAKAPGKHLRAGEGLLDLALDECVTEWFR